MLIGIAARLNWQAPKTAINLSPRVITSKRIPSQPLVHLRTSANLDCCVCSTMFRDRGAFTFQNWMISICSSRLTGQGCFA